MVRCVQTRHSDHSTFELPADPLRSFFASRRPCSRNRGRDRTKSLFWVEAVPSVRQGGIAGGERPFLELRIRRAIPTPKSEPGSSSGADEYINTVPLFLLPLVET